MFKNGSDERLDRTAGQRGRQPRSKHEPAADRLGRADHPATLGSPHQYACERANRLFCWGWFKQNWSSTLWPALRQHIVLVLIAVAIGFAISMALALLAHRYRAVEQPVIVVHLVPLHDPVAGALRAAGRRFRAWG